MKYRSEIDGLRAIAVVPVILFHAGFERFSGGFVGVDVFFVISGYLITTILIEDIENKRFSIVNFYERRARRILPALFFIMLVCIAFAWMFMILPSQIEDFSQSLVAVSLFASNIFFWMDPSGYFDGPSEEKPLLHTWSLAVEEQYYILFPIFLILAWRFGKNRVFWMIVVMATVSLMLSEWGSRNKPSANFYLAPTRAWELFAGSIAAFVVQKHGVQKNNLLAMLGLVAIIFSIFAYDESTPFPSVYALVPVLGTMLLVLYAEKDTLVARVLSTKVFVGIGLISYSAYLWHQPLLAFARILRGGMVDKWTLAISSLLSLALGYLSWRYVENYYRNKQKVSSKSIFLLSGLGFIFFASIGFFGYFKAKDINTGSFNSFHTLLSLKLGSYVANNGTLQHESWEIIRELSGDESYGVSSSEFDLELWFDLSIEGRKILLVGNSHSNDLFNILHQSSQFLLKNQVARFGEQIRKLNNEAHLFWDSKNYQAASHIFIATSYLQEDTLALPKIIERVRGDGKKILIVSHIFEFPGEASGFNLIDKVVVLNSNLELENLSRKINHTYYDYFKSDQNNRSVSINAQLSKIAKKYQIPILNRMDYLCDENLEMVYAVEMNLSKNFYDGNHHTRSGAYYFANHPGLLRKFLEPLELDD